MTPNRMLVEIFPPKFCADRYLLRARVSGHPRARRRNGVIFFDIPAELHG